MSLAVKRMADFAAAVLAGTALAPLWIGVSLAIRWSMGPPVLFRQLRPGLKGKPFTLVKFRTMNHAKDRDGRLLPDHERLTRLGRFLRKTSLDEIPQLWNVFRGHMSLVGPRPLLMEYLDYYSPEQARRHDVVPGITGWAQVNGRNALSWEDKFRLDVWYVDNWSLALDVRIIFMTIAKVLKGEGVTPTGSENVEFFRGSPDQSG